MSINGEERRDKGLSDLVINRVSDLPNLPKTWRDPELGERKERKKTGKTLFLPYTRTTFLEELRLVEWMSGLCVGMNHSCTFLSPVKMSGESTLEDLKFWSWSYSRIYWLSRGYSTRAIYGNVKGEGLALSQWWLLWNLLYPDGGSPMAPYTRSSVS